MVAVDEGFDVTFDDAQRRAQLVRGVGDEVTAHALEFALAGHVMDHEERPLGFAVGCRDRRAGHLDPQCVLAVGDLEFFAWQLGALASGPHVVEERDTAHDQLQAQVQQLAGGGEDFPQRTVGEMDVVRLVDDEHRFAQVAERGFQLRQLVGALLLQGGILDDEPVDGIGECPPGGQITCGAVLVQQRQSTLGGVFEFGEGAVLFPERVQREPEGDREDDGNEKNHAGSFLSAIR